MKFNEEFIWQAVNFSIELVAFASTSLGAAKLRAAAISIPGFADQEQENKTRGLQEPQLLFLWMDLEFAAN